MTDAATISTPISTTASRLAAAPPPALRPGPASFARTLEAATRAGGARGEAGFDRARARAAATQFVSSALVLPVLESLRDGPFNQEGPFAPGSAERRFAPLLDLHLADRITGASSFTLVDTIVDRLERLGRPGGPR